MMQSDVRKDMVKDRTREMACVGCGAIGVCVEDHTTNKLRRRKLLSFHFFPSHRRFLFRK